MVTKCVIILLTLVFLTEGDAVDSPIDTLSKTCQDSVGECTGGAATSLEDEVSLVQLVTEHKSKVVGASEHDAAAAPGAAPGAAASTEATAARMHTSAVSIFAVPALWEKETEKEWWSDTTLVDDFHKDWYANLGKSFKPLHSKADTPPEPCFKDLEGSCWMAGFTMAAGIKLTTAISVALMYYLIIKQRAERETPPEVPAADDIEPIRKKRHYIDTLDGLRTFLIISVILAHYPMGIPTMGFRALFFGWPMQVFFVLSGFVAFSSQEIESDRFDWLNGVAYVVRRLARILPMYQMALIFQYALAVYDGRACSPVLAWPINALLMQVFVPFRVCGFSQFDNSGNLLSLTEFDQQLESGGGYDYAWTSGYTHWNGNYPAWFAACIAWFACIFPLLYNFRPRSGSGTLVLLVAILVVRAGWEILQPDWSSYGWGPHLYAMAPIRLLEYMAGMCAAQAATLLGTWWHNWKGWCWLFDGSLVLLFGMAFVSLRFIHSDWAGSGDYNLTAVCCLVCIAARLAAEMPETSKRGLRGAILHRLFRSTVLVYPSRFTYAAYIFQVSFMSFTDHVWPFNFHPHRFCLLWIFAVFVTMYVDEPLRKAVDTRLKGFRPAVDVK